MDLEQIYYQTNRLLNAEVDAFDHQEQALAQRLRQAWDAIKATTNPAFHQLYEDRLTNIERKAQRQ